MYSHLSNTTGGGNKKAGGAKVVKSILGEEIKRGQVAKLVKSLSKIHMEGEF
jgi:hypothetical protein